MSEKSIKLADGNTIPQIGLGVAFMDETNTKILCNAAIEAGYRLFDNAAKYGNEAEVGATLAASDISREEFFITSKVWPTMMGYDKVMTSFDQSMEKLQLDKIDLFLLHWPSPARNLYVESWQALIELQKQGRIRSIGVSNFFPDQLDRLKSETGVMPVINQIEVHPYNQRPEERAFHAANNIITEAWSPLGRGNCLADPIIADIAKKHGHSPAQIILRWLLDQDLVIIPRTRSVERIIENFNTGNIALDDTDRAALQALDKGIEGKIEPDPQDTK